LFTKCILSSTTLQSRCVTICGYPCIRGTVFTSVSEALVPLIVTLLWLSIVAQMLIASPGTYPPRSSRTRHVTGPVVIHVIPSLCSISQWNGCWNIINSLVFLFISKWQYFVRNDEQNVRDVSQLLVISNNFFRYFEQNIRSWKLKVKTFRGFF